MSTPMAEKGHECSVHLAEAVGHAVLGPRTHPRDTHVVAADLDSLAGPDISAPDGFIERPGSGDCVALHRRARLFQIPIAA